MNAQGRGFQQMKLVMVASSLLGCTAPHMGDADAGADLLSTAPPKVPMGPPGMVTVAGGTFLMGTSATMADKGYDPESQREEQRPHGVTVAAFYLDQTEVTVAAYKTCVEMGTCTAPMTGSLCNWSETGKENHPINCVDWHQASAYCSFVQKRLPTEEEWEYAARGTEGSRYPWGASPPNQDLCWKRDLVSCDAGTCSLGTCEIGQYDKTLLGQKAKEGVADLAGNVWEWTATQYCGAYSGAQECGTKYVVRGGSWGVGDPRLLRAAFRGVNAATDRYVAIGLRCAKTP